MVRRIKKNCAFVQLIEKPSGLPKKLPNRLNGTGYIRRWKRMKPTTFGIHGEPFTIRTKVHLRQSLMAVHQRRPLPLRSKTAFKEIRSPMMGRRSPNSTRSLNRNIKNFQRVIPALATALIIQYPITPSLMHYLASKGENVRTKMA